MHKQVCKCTAENNGSEMGRRQWHEKKKKQLNASEWNELFISIEKGQVINFAFYFYHEEKKSRDMVWRIFCVVCAIKSVCVWLKLAVCGKLFSTNEMKMREYTPYFSHVVFLDDSSGYKLSFTHKLTAVVTNNACVCIIAAYFRLIGCFNVCRVVIIEIYSHVLRSKTA